MHNKRLGKDAMRRAEACIGVAPEQFKSQHNKSADLQALNTRLFYDHVLLKKIPSTSVSIDLVSNYDLVVDNIASLALQRVGVPKTQFPARLPQYKTWYIQYGQPTVTHSKPMVVICG
eukprot:10961713-Ditylum_brightwellii.AAC.1